MGPIWEPQKTGWCPCVSHSTLFTTSQENRYPEKNTDTLKKDTPMFTYVQASIFQATCSGKRMQPSWVPEKPPTHVCLKDLKQFSYKKSTFGASHPANPYSNGYGSKPRCPGEHPESLLQKTTVEVLTHNQMKTQPGRLQMVIGKKQTSGTAFESWALNWKIRPVSRLRNRQSWRLLTAQPGDMRAFYRFFGGGFEVKLTRNYGFLGGSLI